MTLIIFCFFAVYLPLPVVAWMRSTRRVGAGAHTGTSLDQ
jgi:hypothetical protein